MPRRAEPLKPKYGKLTVVRENASLVLCRCDCGKERVVARSNLRSGQTKSCGATECRAYVTEPGSGGKRGPKYKGPAWTTPRYIPKIWEAYHAGQQAPYIAAMYQTSSQQVYGLIKRIRLAGGIIPYMGLINEPVVARGYRPYPVPDKDPAAASVETMPAIPQPPATYVPTASEFVASAPVVVSPLGIAKPPSIYTPPPKRR